MENKMKRPALTETIQEIHLRIAVEDGGGKFAGIQPGFYVPSTGEMVETLCLFNSRRTGTTLGLKVSEVSVSKVRKHIQESDTLFDDYKEKAALFVLRDFATTPSKFQLIRKALERAKAIRRAA